ncbi:Transglutaminase-like enzyme, putative cysteine protease [bacterium A37T11]|nr:Transglutaminase-like enzyme, putative cysteine protease [bacterium A37T11]
MFIYLYDMLIEASCLLDFTCDSRVPSIFMLRPKSGVGQFVVREDLRTTPYLSMTEFADNYGNLCQRIVLPIGTFQVESRVVADCADEIDVDYNAWWVPIEYLPDYILHFLLPSRYCESDKLGNMAMEISLGKKPGYEQVESIRQWINSHIRYEYGTTNSSTSALDIVTSGVGVCRDFAHLGISLCRALDIPARMVTGYLYGLKPMDLHAWFEAYIGGRWYCFDATQTEPKGKRIQMAYGRDAADVAFATHFGNVYLNNMIVKVEECTDLS